MTPPLINKRQSCSVSAAIPASNSWRLPSALLRVTEDHMATFANGFQALA